MNQPRGSVVEAGAGFLLHPATSPTTTRARTGTLMLYPMKLNPIKHPLLPPKNEYQKSERLSEKNCFIHLSRLVLGSPISSVQALLYSFGITTRHLPPTVLT